MSAGRSWLEAEQRGAQAGQDGLRARGSVSEKRFTFLGEPTFLVSAHGKPKLLPTGMCISCKSSYSQKENQWMQKFFVCAEITSNLFLTLSFSSPILMCSDFLQVTHTS